MSKPRGRPPKVIVAARAHDWDTVLTEVAVGLVYRFRNADEDAHRAATDIAGEIRQLVKAIREAGDGIDTDSELGAFLNESAGEVPAVMAQVTESETCDATHAGLDQANDEGADSDPYDDFGA
ncbi:hypothetical protein [Nocardia sp. NPDC020380]|uniref:hypothetical protein n=1 Tax=Nocardia sp. NPDC020380 TaxID=3364309 RepID=UPI0037ACE012